MSADRHEYDVVVTWTGNRGRGTATYGAYGREHEVTYGGSRRGDSVGEPTQGWVGDPPAIAGSADPAFRGDPTRWNPEQLLVAAVSQCHMLWFLHLAVEAGVVVTAYQDRAHGVMVVDGTGGPGGGRFDRVVLRPVVALAGGTEGSASDTGHGADEGDAATRRLHEQALSAHHEAHARCFIANSLSIPVEVEPEIRTPESLKP